MNRSKGITILAWMLLVGSVLNSITSLASFIWKLPAGSANPTLSTYFYFFASPLSIFVGISLLRLRNWARIAALVLSILVALETILTTPYVLKQLVALDPREAFLTQCALGSMVSCSLIFNGAILYYFTRPRVKAQFQ